MLTPRMLYLVPHILLFYVLYCKHNFCSSVQAGKGVKLIFCAKTSTFEREKKLEDFFKNGTNNKVQNLIKKKTFIFFLNMFYYSFISIKQCYLGTYTTQTANHQDSVWTAMLNYIKERHTASEDHLYPTVKL